MEDLINSVGSNNLSLKYQMFTPPDNNDIGIRKSEFVAKTQLLCSPLLVGKINFALMFSILFMNF